MLRNWLILAALWILSLIAISFYGGPVSYGFLTVITLIPVVSLAYLMLVLARFKVYQRFECPRIVCNHVIPFYFTLQNEDWFAFSGVRVSFYSDFSSIEGLSDNTEYELLPKTKIKKETKLICRYRGEYLVGIKSITLRDYLCLFRITCKNREPLRAVVDPDIIVLNSIKGFDIDSVSDRESPESISHPDVTIRDYIAGDDIRRINWKQTARTGKLSVRNYTGEEKDGIGLIIDTTRTGVSQNEYLPVENRILELAIALSLFLRSKNIPVSAYCYHNGVVEHIIDSPQTFNEFYRAMSSISFHRTPDRSGMYRAFAEEKNLFSKRIVSVITPDADAAVLNYAGLLNDSNTDAIIYLVKSGDPDTAESCGLSHTKMITVPTEDSLKNII